jgi:hypothetical protein
MTSTVPTAVHHLIKAISLLAVLLLNKRTDLSFLATFIDRAAISEMPASINMIPNFFIALPSLIDLIQTKSIPPFTGVHFCTSAEYSQLID